MQMESKQNNDQIVCTCYGYILQLKTIILNPYYPAIINRRNCTESYLSPTTYSQMFHDSVLREIDITSPTNGSKQKNQIL